MVSFPITFEEIEKIYKSHDKSATGCHWTISCSTEKNNMMLSQLLLNNALAVFGYGNTLFIKVPRFGVDVGVNDDPYRHSKVYYVSKLTDLKEKWSSFSGNIISELRVELFDKSANPIHRWTFKECLVRDPREVLLDIDQANLIIPIIFHENPKSESL